MEALLFMGIAGGNWIPLLAILIAPMAAYLCIEWAVNFTEKQLRKRLDVHKLSTNA